MKKILENMSPKELRAMVWKAKYIRFKGKVKRNADRLSIILGIITLVIAFITDITHKVPYALAGWGIIALFVATLFLRKAEKPNAHWIHRTLPKE